MLRRDALKLLEMMVTEKVNSTSASTISNNTAPVLKRRWVDGRGRSWRRFPLAKRGLGLEYLFVSGPAVCSGKISMS